MCEKFENDVKYINEQSMYVFNYWELLTPPTMKILFAGIQNRDLSEYMVIFERAMKSMHAVREEAERNSRNAAELKENHRTLIQPPVVYETFTVKQLKEELTRFGRYPKGNKAELLQQLETYRVYLRN